LEETVSLEWLSEFLGTLDELSANRQVIVVSHCQRLDWLTKGRFSGSRPGRSDQRPCLDRGEAAIDDGVSFNILTREVVRGEMATWTSKGVSVFAGLATPAA